ncbi:MAG: acetyl-CoA carboxylase biotin carboxyl carrier protein [Clostridiales bacterium]|nr:acetyl-CoA carboxylase biotin carboxyl carrier protein [Clostridiales bacterium]
MDIKKLKQLVHLLQSSDLTALELCEGDTRIRMERNGQASTLPKAALSALPSQPLSQSSPEPMEASLSLEQAGQAVDFNRLTEVKSPMVGVFYAAPSPDAGPYVRRGDKVKKGDVLCVIEAMKLLNEIVAETDGEIADICVQNGQVVEFSQTLFKLF